MSARILSFFLFLALPALARTLTIGVPPNEADRPLGELAAALSQRSGLTVKVVAPADYNQLLQGFRSGKIDFAFFSGLNFLQVEREGIAKVLLKKVYSKGGEFYYTAIVTRADAKLGRMEDLKGKKFAFVDQQSTSGYLFPRVMLKRAGMDAGPLATPGPSTLPHEFLGTHEKALQAVLDGRVAAAAVWASDPEKKIGLWNEAAFAKHVKDVKVIAFSDPIPNDAFAVRKAVWAKEPGTVLKLMDALISLEDDTSKILQRVFNVDRMVTATSRHYDSVRALEALLSEKK